MLQIKKMITDDLVVFKEKFEMQKYQNMAHGDGQRVIAKGHMSDLKSVGNVRFEAGNTAYHILVSC